MKLTYQHIKEAQEYLLSKESFNDTKKNLILQTVAFLNNKWPNNLITVDIERELISIQGEDREAILNDLREIGLVK